MTPRLSGVRVAMLASDGVAQTEFAYLSDQLRLEQANVTVAAPRPGRVWTTLDDLTPGHDITVDCVLEDLKLEAVDALLLPSGVVSATRLRVGAEVISLIADFHLTGRPIGVRGDSIALMIEAQLVRHRRVSTLPHWRTDVRNAGGVPVVDDVVIDDPVISSAGPGDLGAYWAALLNHLSPPRTPRPL